MYIQLLLVEYQSCFPHCFHSVSVPPLRGAELRFELGPALQQANTLLSEPHLTLRKNWLKIPKFKKICDTPPCEYQRVVYVRFVTALYISTQIPMFYIQYFDEIFFLKTPLGS
jgi:hypothetical protein